MKRSGSTDNEMTKEPEIEREYIFDYEKALPNRFAGRLDKNRIVVMLDPDVSKVFKSSQDVNSILRGILQNMPKKNKPKPGKSTS